MRWKFIEEFVMQGQSIRHGACTPGSKQAPLHSANVQHQILAYPEGCFPSLLASGSIGISLFDPGPLSVPMGKPSTSIS